MSHFSYELSLLLDKKKTGNNAERATLRKISFSAQSGFLDFQKHAIRMVACAKVECLDVEPFIT